MHSYNTLRCGALINGFDKKAEEEALRVLKQYLIDAGATIEGLLVRTAWTST